MEDLSKVILGLEQKKQNRQPRRIYTDAEKHFILNEWLGSGLSKQAIWEKYTGQGAEHGQIIRWMRTLGYIVQTEPSPTPIKMAKKSDELSPFEQRQLQKRVEELEQQLKEAQMKSIALSMMVDMAEEEFKISIRKKYNTKRSKK